MIIRRYLIFKSLCFCERERDQSGREDSNSNYTDRFDSAQRPGSIRLYALTKILQSLRLRSVTEEFNHGFNISKLKPIKSLV